MEAERARNEENMVEIRKGYEEEKRLLELKLNDNKSKEAYDKAIQELQKEFEMDKQDFED